MKGGIGAAIIAMKALLKAGYRPEGDVLIQCVVGEEHHETYAGTGAALERGYRADAAIVCEPSTPPLKLSINTASPGLVLMHIKVKGKATHISNRDELTGLGAGEPQWAYQQLTRRSWYIRLCSNWRRSGDRQSNILRTSVPVISSFSLWLFRAEM
jgi:hypothetical protein